ncbi:MAG: GTPase [Acholeplasmataceae bacterium]|jgi:ribosome biogenesis GTPase A|nr:GTPase [Acholeplasmataceae bacterium]
MSLTIRCKGCGALLQTTDPQKVGYALSTEHDYCQSCYRLFHYGESAMHFHPEDLPMLPPNSVIVMVSSVLHLDLLFSYPVYRYQPDAKFVYIINQIDLLPKGTNLDKLLHNIKQKANRLSIPYEDLILMSAKNQEDIKHLQEYLKDLNEPNVYLLGVQNSGKTTLFKAITQDKQALAMKKAGLTQEALKKSYDDMMIYDMPGLYQQGYLHEILPYGIYKDLIPDKEINPKIYQLSEGQSLFIEGLIAISFHGQAINPVLYLDRNIRMHRTKEDRVNELIHQKEKHFKIYALSYEEKQFKIPEGKVQITFADMGFMQLEGPGWIKVTYPKGLHISLSEALFND